MKLGKQSYKHDERTLALGDFLEVPKIPSIFDFDKRRRPFPVHVWGNDFYGDCVIAGQANCLVRLERVEQKRTISIVDKDAIDRYKALTGCQQPDDENDTGLVVLDALNDWRLNGFNVKKKNYRIAAYGELDPLDSSQLRAACYLLGGIHFGFSLPRSVHGKDEWDVSTGPGTEPGSWGGHLVFGKKYDPDGFEVLSWGRKIYVTNAFINKYCDEAWSVVDDLDKWRKSDHLDVQAMLAKLHSVGATHIGG